MWFPFVVVVERRPLDGGPTRDRPWVAVARVGEGLQAGKQDARADLVTGGGRLRVSGVYCQDGFMAGSRPSSGRVMRNADRPVREMDGRRDAGRQAQEGACDGDATLVYNFARGRVARAAQRGQSRVPGPALRVSHGGPILRGLHVWLSSPTPLRRCHISVLSLSNTLKEIGQIEQLLTAWASRKTNSSFCK